MTINLLSYLEQTEKKFPDKVAFADENQAYTYSELAEYAKRIGTGIAAYNVFRKPIVVYLENSVRAVTAFMGSLYSGNFYCPIDVSMPIERLKTILNVLETPIIITDETHKKNIEGIVSNEEILLYDEIITGQSDDEVLSRIRLRVIDMDPAYVIFTSGSTGIPKGVVVSHQSVVDYTEWVTNTFRITNEDSIGNQAPFYFDNSVLDIYCGLKNGATVYIIPKQHFAFPVKLLEYLEEKHITTIFFVPSVLCIVARLRALKKVQPKYLNKILFAGEVMPNKYLNVWRQYLPDAVYANLYGPTEITVDCTYYIVDREFQDDEPLPIGKACQNTDILILNEENKEAMKGEIGELCVRGRSLALGYYKNPEKSNEVFIQNPLNTDYRDWIYRTGDLVKVNEYDEIIFMGRKDYQIKHMGHRIELGEIEVAVGDLDSIDTCVCIYDDIKQRIIFIYKGDVKDTDFLEKIFKEKVPEYMVPNIYLRIDEFPHNANGKIDRKKLKEAYQNGTIDEYRRV